MDLQVDRLRFNYVYLDLIIRMAQITRRSSRDLCDLMTECSCQEENGAFFICGRCQSCVLNDKLNQFTQWMQNSDKASQKRFLTGILMRCKHRQIMESLRWILGVTSGKDFTYSSSIRQSDKTKNTNNNNWSAKLYGIDMLETWEWFRKSPEWSKSNFLLGVLSLCDTHLLRMLGNLARNLIAWEKHRFIHFDSAGENLQFFSFLTCFSSLTHCTF